MKHGPIIFDPTSEEAKALVGKRVVGFRNYSDFNREPELRNSEIAIGDLNIEDGMFVIHCEGDYAVIVPFVAEAVEGKPVYRPYKDTDEMVDDFKKRFCGHTTIPQFAKPLIWVKNSYSESFNLITNFCGRYVLMGPCEGPMNDMFEGYRYLDGSPVGKEMKK